MKILFYMPDAEAAAWLHDFARALPHADLREWQPGDTARRLRCRLAAARARCWPAAPICAPSSIWARASTPSSRSNANNPAPCRAMRS
ncbi:MAG: D-3-phosphoglycerate dehydrogenase (EC [uncultured Paraburkholderia sp.]|nr:MAG: D-3-phosphoglycerate dehydrogenase (EC [uncultured Paraburkholderia sp.]